MVIVGFAIGQNFLAERPVDQRNSFTCSAHLIRLSVVLLRKYIYIYIYIYILYIALNLDEYTILLI